MKFNVALATIVYIVSVLLNFSIELTSILIFGSLILCVCCDIYEQGRDK